MKQLIVLVLAAFTFAAQAQDSATTPVHTDTSSASSTMSTDKPGHLGVKVTPPKLIRQVEPEYSEEARQDRFSGVVDVYLVVDENGKPQDVRVAKPAGHGLDENAVKAVKKYRFKPAMKDGKPVKVDMYVRVSFSIFSR
jgi:TonB family protein